MTRFQYACKTLAEKHIDERWWTVKLPHGSLFFRFGLSRFGWLWWSLDNRTTAHISDLDALARCFLHMVRFAHTVASPNAITFSLTDRFHSNSLLFVASLEP
jgi:hypothetical protein